MNFDGRHVLIVEDEPIIAFGLEDMLVAEGASVSVATALDEAEDLLADIKPDWAILDVNLRGTKSYGFASDLEGRGIGYIFATGYGDAEHPPDFQRVPTITKPYSIQHIRDAITRLT
ncbi:MULTISPECIES: response regulator [unclassified Erythrobacter]|uniref:response regulator n=1 Tax=unclassified Erythrobacter TaxID=2633097 RepID=UPI00076D67A0|nr:MULTISPECIES: response regulator [unclassified Erythrobacter]KWV95912.1 hypothetical protein ASS64_01420 [Erythrobacter sp. AP23]MBO6769533.1 response regulator [Erythrobacter sp.]